jgi:hypothetical protein
MRRYRILAVVGLVALAIVFAAWFGLSRSTTPPGHSAISPSDAARARDVRDPRDDARDATRSRESPAQLADSAAPLGLDAAANRDSASAASVRTPSGHQLRVLDASTGKPVVGAAVRSAHRPPSFVPDPAAAEDYVHGEPVALTDSEGLVLLPTRVAGVVVAHTQDAWGWAHWRKGGVEPSELRVEPDPTLRVRCIDARGAAVIGAPIELQSSAGSGKHIRRFARTRAPDGVARFDRTDLDGKSIRCVLAVFAPERIAHEIADSARARAAIAWVLPDVGTLEVSVREPDGRWIADDSPIRLHVESREDAAGSAPSEDRSGGPGSFAVTRGGRASFQVAVGDYGIVASCRRARMPTPGSSVPQTGGGEASAWASVRAPSRSGQVQSLALALGSHWPILAGRAVTDSGAVLPYAAWTARSDASAGPALRGDTDADGNFWIEFRSRKWTEAGSVTLRIDEPLRYQTLAPLSVPRESGLHAIGDVVFAALAPRVVRGVVVDGAHRPVSAAAVELWDGARELRRTARSDEAGRFELELLPEWPRPNLIARRDGAESARVYVSNASSALELVLEPWGTLAGRVALPPDFAAAEFSVHVETRDRHGNYGGAGSQRQQLVLDEVGRFESQPLPLEQCRVSWRLKDLQLVLASVDGIDVRSAEQTSDPRLDPLVSTLALRRLALSVVYADREPLGSGTATWRWSASNGARDAGQRPPLPGDPSDLGVVLRRMQASSEPPLGETRVAAGQTSVVATHAAVAVVVSAPGFQSVELVDVQGGETVVLRPLRYATIELVDPRVQPAAPAKLLIALVATQPSNLPRTWVEFDASGIAHVPVPGPGRYRVEWRVTAGDTLRSASTERYEIYVELGEPVEHERARIDASAEWWAPSAPRTQKSLNLPIGVKLE